jgi:uncharacterized protein YdiU (UPF0061 family)
MIAFDNTYVHLPVHMFTRQAATHVADPKMIVTNAPLAATLGIAPEWVKTDTARDVFAGNMVADGSDPLAAAYAGHQFGNWNPTLGDGRAVLLGEVVGTDGVRRDIQLKGSGPTPYSRSGDGRAWLGPVLREYLVSEAMHAMGVPTTRALAAVTTGETVYRETPLPGAIITRVASSHIRVGTFQSVAARGDIDALRALYDHVVARHYPDADSPAELLLAVTKAQATLVAKWMGLGFVHGVMNTDNVSIAGETIDYGPCAFMDTYDANSVFSAIDRHGRYAYQNQPRIAAWNLAQFATALIPLMPDQDAAIKDFTAIINTFFDHYDTAWTQVFGAKLGLVHPTAEDRDLMTGLLTLMQTDGADFTTVFANLASPAAHDQFTDQAAFAAWVARWQTRGYTRDIMASANPRIIPRNHQVEAMITAACAGDFAPFHAMLAAVTDPFAPLTVETSAYAVPPAASEQITQTFCGT